ncbi:MAG: aminotransferase class I/II-fold pyridoxal phosphate-dependent enzyme [Bacteroidetes bacterium]|nr:aminotransferase class I/II-fold pyridoxal phosphate-dependent enzyme [Bacteroidota bacterium]
MDTSYIINQLGEERDSYMNAVSPPIFQTSIFKFNDVATMRESLKKEYEIPFYTRGYNPTVAILRKKIAALAGAEDALVFASGSASVAAAVMSSVKAGDHIVTVKKPYSWTNKLFIDYLPRFDISATMIDGTDAGNYEAAIQDNTKLIYLESPNSITFELQDIEKVVKIAKDRGLTTILDNSYSTPLNQQPIKLGVDMTVHSASKYFGGHSDIIAGILCSSKERIHRIFGSEFMTIGGIISPNDAWLMIRSMRTLPIRLEKIAKTTLQVVEFLEGNEAIGRMIYPFSKSHPQFELAQKQMQRGGGLFSIELKTEEIDRIEGFCNNLKRFLLACSWGGYESLVFPMAALHNTQNYDTELQSNLIRFSIGLEEPELLIEDLKQAIDQYLL